jgi:AcrR family transcriptional regulator
MPSKRPVSRSPRAKRKTIEVLLEAAQDILAESGLEALNSNAISERAGVTPPTFYHYFPNKHALLSNLGTQMMLAQSEVLRADTGLQIKTEADLHAACLRSVRQSFKTTREFRGGYALLVLLRALPELRPIRLNSHAEMSVLLANYFIEQGLGSDIEGLTIRARLGLEMSYAAIEMLFETDFANEEIVLERSAAAITRIYDFF